MRSNLRLSAGGRSARRGSSEVEGLGCLLVIVLIIGGIGWAVVDSASSSAMAAATLQAHIAANTAVLGKELSDGVELLEVRQAMHEYHHKGGVNRWWTTVAVAQSISSPEKRVAVLLGDNSLAVQGDRWSIQLDEAGDYRLKEMLKPATAESVRAEKQ